MSIVAVVGGSGFVGTRLLSDLRASGHDAIVVDVAVPESDDVPYRQADIRDRGSLVEALKGVEIVYNLAAVHRDDVKPESLYHDVNVTGAVNVCDVCREVGVTRIIFTSSVAVYGLAEPKTSEPEPPAPVNAYGRTKLLAEDVHREWQTEAPERRSLVIVRPTVVFGEQNRGNVYQLVHQIISRRFLMVGSGHNRKSMAYVGNLSAFLSHVISLGAGNHLFNYVDEPDLSMEELVATILLTLGRRSDSMIRIPYVVGYQVGVACDVVAVLTGRRLPISAIRVKKFCSTTTFSSGRVAATGFHPPFGLRDAIVRTIRCQADDAVASGS